MEELHRYCFQMLEENRYLKLPSEFYELVRRGPLFSAPQVLLWNETLAELTKIDVPPSERAEVFSGNKPLVGLSSFAMAYAGHQFGNFVPQLGDGRALMLGQARDSEGLIYDVHLKGSGPTSFSRRGDGLSALGPCLREYMISHWMKNLGVPTSESLCVVTTGETVYRESPLPGAVLTRLARSHIRVGTFEYFAAKGDSANLRKLLDFAIQDLYPELSNRSEEDQVFDFFNAVLQRQARTIVLWLKYGFIHGVMNTDNTSISGETIDYGPCAFMDQFHPDTVFSSIDRGGRYRYSQQGDILFWNLSALASALLVLWPEGKRKIHVSRFEEILQSGYKYFQELWGLEFSKKIGFAQSSKESLSLLDSFLGFLQKESMDFTKSFRGLSRVLKNQSLEGSTEFQNWLKDWSAKIPDRTMALKLIEANNPMYIPRNHLVERALSEAVDQNDLSFFNQLYEIGRTPFSIQAVDPLFENPPEQPDRSYRTFCGT
jgi:uncharacterized protein YdiU (UPF0061 family)